MTSTSLERYIPYATVYKPCSYSHGGESQSQPVRRRCDAVFVRQQPHFSSHFVDFSFEEAETNEQQQRQKKNRGAEADDRKQKIIADSGDETRFRGLKVKGDEMGIMRWDEK